MTKAITVQSISKEDRRIIFYATDKVANHLSGFGSIYHYPLFNDKHSLLVRSEYDIFEIVRFMENVT